MLHFVVRTVLNTAVYRFNGYDVNRRVCSELELISGFHRALLQSLLLEDQMHLIIQNLDVKIHGVKNLKYIKLKITPTCFGSCAIHHQGV